MFKFFLSLSLLAFSPLFSELTDAMKSKIGGLFVGTFYGNTVDEKAVQLIQETSIGNWIFFSKCTELTDKTSVKELLISLSDACERRNGRRPLLWIDQEGGRVTHLKGEFKQFPEPAQWQSQEQAEMYGRELGAELIEAGFSGNLAPVVDIAHALTFERFKPRLFGDDPEKVILMARALIKGMHQSGSLAVLKHFPGHGAARGDSHVELPIVEKTWEQLVDWDLKPFAELAGEVDGVLVAHLLLPAVDSQQPASKSARWIQDVLRKRLNFDGLILTDSLTMHACLKGELGSLEDASHAIAEAALEAFKAGSDLLVIGPLDGFSFEGGAEANARMLGIVFRAFWDAVERGEISEARIDESLKRLSACRSNSYFFTARL